MHVLVCKWVIIQHLEAETANRDFSCWSYLLCFLFHFGFFIFSVLFRLCFGSSGNMIYPSQLGFVMLQDCCSDLVHFSLHFNNYSCYFFPSTIMIHVLIYLTKFCLWCTIVLIGDWGPIKEPINLYLPRHLACNLINKFVSVSLFHNHDRRGKIWAKHTFFLSIWRFALVFFSFSHWRILEFIFSYL